MSNDDLKSCIQDAVVLLENYRSFGPMVEEGIAAFKRVNECVADPSPEAIKEAKSLIDEMVRRIGPYRSMVPEVSRALDKLSKWSDEINEPQSGL